MTGNIALPLVVWPVLLAMLFIVVILPAWLIIDFARSPRPSIRAKVIWITLMVLCWPFAALAYGAFVAKASSLRLISRIGLALAIIGTAIGITAMVTTMPMYQRQTKEAIEQTSSQLDSVAWDLSVEEQRQLKNALDSLASGLAGETPVRLSLPNEASRSIVLYELLEAMILDRRLTREEYDDWMSRYRLGGQLKRDALEAEIRRRRRASASSPTTP